MKGLNKLALATAVAAAPFATQAMEPMSDKAMGETTGQAGVTIELDTNLSMDQIAYSQGENTGSFLVNDVEIGGIGGPFGDSLDLAINVDLVEDNQTPDDVKSGQNPRPYQRGQLNDGDALISLKNIENDGSAPVDANIKIGNGDATDNANNGDAFQLQNSDGSESATLISDLDMDMFLSQLDVIAQVEDLDGDTGNEGSLGIDVAFSIDQLDVSFDVASVSLEGMRMAGAGSMPNLKEDQNIGSGASVTNPAIVSMDIGAGGAVNSDIDEALNINLATFEADIWMPTVNVGNNTGGGSSIGSVAISELTLTDTEIAVYGRD